MLKSKVFSIVILLGVFIILFVLLAIKQKNSQKISEQNNVNSTIVNQEKVSKRQDILPKMTNAVNLINSIAISEKLNDLYKVWDIRFERTKRGSAFDILHTSDDGYIVVGAVRGLPFKPWIAKLDSDGKVEWEKILDIASDGIVMSIIETSTGDYAVAVDSGWATIVAVLDNSGNPIWHRKYKLYIRNPDNLIQTRDGGYALIGAENRENTSSDVLLIKLDSNGDTEWKKYYGGDDFDLGRNIYQENNGDYTLVSSTSPLKSSLYLIRLMRTDGEGNIKWEKEYGIRRDDGHSASIKTKDNGFIIAGVHDLIRVDNVGNVLWSLKIDDQVRSVYQTHDEGVVVASFVYGRMVTKVKLIKLDKHGNKEWEKSVRRSTWNDVNSIVQSSVDSYIFTGETGEDAWVVKLERKEVSEPITPKPYTVIWQKMFFGRPGMEEIEPDYDFSSIEKSINGGFLLAGIKEYHDAWAVAINGDGNKLWHKDLWKTYNYHENVYMTATGDDKYFLAGKIHDADNYISGVVKIEQNGDIIWKKHFKDKSYTIHSIASTDDNGVLIASNGDNGEAPYIIKLDTNGEKEWDIVFEREGVNKDREKSCLNYYRGSPQSIIQTDEGGYLFVGSVNCSKSDSDYDGWAVKLDKTGEMEWEKYFWGMKDDHFYDVAQTIDGGYIITGNTSSFGPGVDNHWILKLDGDGNKVWDRSSAGTKYDRANSIIQTRDRGYVVVGKKFNEYHKDTEAWVMKFDENSDLIFQDYFSIGSNSEANDVIEADDGGLVVCGVTGSRGWIFKLEVNDN